MSLNSLTTDYTDSHGTVSFPCSCPDGLICANLRNLW